MNWYPWLNQTYRQLIMSYQKNAGHHALLLHSPSGNGKSILCYGLSRWLICQNTNDFQSCGVCHSCRLMLAGTHPDYHILELNKNTITIGVDEVRKLIEVLNNHAQQNGAKVVYIRKTEVLTNAATNALLKILEEPTKRTYFLLCCENWNNLFITLRSRCLYRFLHPPTLQIALHWLKKQIPSVNDDDAVTALKLCQGAPVTAMLLLKPEHWQKRSELCHGLLNALNNNDMLLLLNIMNNTNAVTCINWLLELFVDSIKLKQEAVKFCVNQDQFPLLYVLASKMTTSQLFYVYKSWRHCRQQLMSIPGLNQELLLINQLLPWEALLTF
ncbi:DNA polymerase III subunit delta' [Candidatus Hartigia pinicola]|nr:DNA polymerase III subunit delta' [Candidatus Hartigia pinicola]